MYRIRVMTDLVYLTFEWLIILKCQKMTQVMTRLTNTDANIDIFW